MRLIEVSELRPGQVLGANLNSLDGRHVLLPKGTVLTIKNLQKIIDWNINRICIEDSKVQAKRVYKEVAKSVDDVFTIIRHSGQPCLDEVSNQSKALVEQVLYNGENILDQMFTLKNIDLYTFHHSVAVAVFSTILGTKLGFSQIELNNLALGAVLHDIGKAYIPLDILNKPGLLTPQEFSEVKEHTIYGYHLLLKVGDFDDSVKAIPHHHHERIDGQGYPSMLRGDFIHPYAKIVAIADIFSALTSNRVYRKKISPFTAAEYLYQQSGKALDESFTSIFIQELIKPWQGSKVYLSDGQFAQVEHVPELTPFRPIVSLENGKIINLKEDIDCYIESVVIEDEDRALEQKIIL